MEDLIRHYVDPMPMDEFKEWVQIPCTRQDLMCCRDWYYSLEMECLKDGKNDLKLIQCKINYLNELIDERMPDRKKELPRNEHQNEATGIKWL